MCVYSDPLPTCVFRQALRGYALILTHPGVPCVFYWDYVGPLRRKASWEDLSYPVHFWQILILFTLFTLLTCEREIVDGSAPRGFNM
jgi:hypothetical protein